MVTLIQSRQTKLSENPTSLKMGIEKMPKCLIIEDMGKSSTRGKSRNVMR